jgi:hypothetical protein
MVLPFCFPLSYVLRLRGPQEAKNLAGDFLRLLQIRLLANLFYGKRPNLSSQAPPNFHLGPRLTAHNAVIRVYDAAANVIETHEHPGEFKEW